MSSLIFADILAGVWGADLEKWSEGLSKRPRSVRYVAPEFGRALLELASRGVYEIPPMHKSLSRGAQKYLYPYLVAVAEIPVNPSSAVELVADLHTQRMRDGRWSDDGSFLGDADDPTKWDLWAAVVAQAARASEASGLDP